MKHARMTPQRMKVFVISSLLLLGGLGLYRLVSSDVLAVLESRTTPLVDSIKRHLSSGAPSEVMPLGDSVYEALKGMLPEKEDWRTFAKPLGLPDRSLLLFQRSGQNAIVWHIDWKAGKASSFPIPEIALATEGRYTALASQDGIWLLGETTVLIQPSNRGLNLKSLWGAAEKVVLNGRRVHLKTQFNEPVETLLHDQSVLVLGSSMHGGKNNDEAPRMKQLRLDFMTQELVVQDRGILSYTGKPNETGKTYRVPRYGHNAVTLDSGQVLMFGGDVTPNLASLIDPGNGTENWIQKPVAALPNPRVFGAAIALPGDRVLITGAPHLGCYGESAKMRSVDVYDVNTRQWSSLPLLPMVPCSDAYGADVPSVTLTPNGSIVVAGHLEPQAMVLRPDTESPTGYEKNWLVVGPMPLRRISGITHALSDQEIVVAGGVDRRGQCCYATSGFDVISLISKPSPNVVQSMMWIEPAVAQKGPWVFVGGGRHFGSTGFGQLRYSAAAELLNRNTGQIETLPNIPFASGAAQAAWLDDDRILFKGMKESAQWGMSSYTPPSSGEMAIYQVRDKRWSTPLAVAGLDRAKLIAAEGNQALFLAGSYILSLDLDSRKTTPLQPAQPSRLVGQAYQMQGGRLIFTEDAIQQETVSNLVPECEATLEDECPEQADRLARLPTQPMDEVAPDPVSALWAGERVVRVITNQGRGMALITASKTEKQSLFFANAEGTAWEEITLPDFGEQDKVRCGACVLLSVADPRAPQQDLIFLRQGAIDMDHMEDELTEQSVRVWAWLEKEKRWQAVLQSSGMAARSDILPLAEPLSSTEGKRMLSLGWHVHNPVLWLEP
jgi:hypothetical protein